MFVVFYLKIPQGKKGDNRRSAPILGTGLGLDPKYSLRSYNVDPQDSPKGTRSHFLYKEVSLTPVYNLLPIVKYIKPN